MKKLLCIGMKVTWQWLPKFHMEEQAAHEWLRCCGLRELYISNVSNVMNIVSLCYFYNNVKLSMIWLLNDAATHQGNLNRNANSQLWKITLTWKKTQNCRTFIKLHQKSKLLCLVDKISKVSEECQSVMQFHMNFCASAIICLPGCVLMYEQL